MQRIHGGWGATSLDFTPPTPSITFFPCKIHRSVRALNLSIRTFILALSGPHGPCPPGTPARPDAPRAAADTSRRHGARRRRAAPPPVSGPRARRSEQRRTRSLPAAAFGSPGPSLARSPAESAPGPPGRAQPRARHVGGGACRRKVLSHGPDARPPSRAAPGSVPPPRRPAHPRHRAHRHGRTRSARVLGLLPSRPVWGCCRRARRWAGRRRGGTRNTCGGTASSSSCTSTAPCATATRMCSSGATRWVRPLRARPPPPLWRAQVPFRCGAGRAVLPERARPGRWAGGDVAVPAGLCLPRAHARPPHFVAQRGCRAVSAALKRCNNFQCFRLAPVGCPGCPAGGVFPGRWCSAALAPSPEFVYAPSMSLSKACLCLESRQCLLGVRLSFWEESDGSRTGGGRAALQWQPSHRVPPLPLHERDCRAMLYPGVPWAFGTRQPAFWVRIRMIARVITWTLLQVLCARGP